MTHILNIAENGIEKYSTQSYENIPLFHSIVSCDATAIEKDIVKYCRNRNRPDGKLLSWHVHQPSHTNQVPASCFCSERKENNDQTCAKNKEE